MSSLFGIKTKPLAGASSFASLETQLFNVLYFLQKETSYHTLYFVATGIQFCHLLNNAFIESTFAWNHDVIHKSGFGMALEYITLELFLVDVAAFYFMFTMAAGIILLLVALTVFMSKALSSGNVPPQRLSRFVQFLVSAMIAFEGPLSRILMAMVECDYGHTGENPYWGWTCFDSPVRIVLYILSISLMVVFIVLIGFFSFMHASSPKSQDACTRTVSWIDTINSMFQISTVVLFRLAWRAPIILSIYFLFGGVLLMVLVSKFQPFYRSTMNCFRVAIHAVTAWTGFCLFLISLIDNRNSAIVSTLYLSLVPMVAWHGWQYCKRTLEARMSEGLGSTVTDDQVIAHDAIIERLRTRGTDMVSETWKDVLGASQVEQRTRFLQTAFTPEDVAKADVVLRAGLKSYPLSEYLLMRYVTFLVVYKHDYVLGNLIINQCLRTHFNDIESRLDIFRLHKDLQRSRQLGDSAAHRNNRGEVDVISFEEAQKTLRSARASHRQAHDHMRALVGDIAKGSATAANVARRAEQIFSNEEHAMECFEVLLSQSEDSAEVYISYGNFLKDVMLDGAAADAMFQMAANCRNHRDDSGSGSSRTALSSKFSRMARLKDIERVRDAKLKKLSWKMRIVTLLLFTIILGVFCIYYFMTEQFMESLLNLNDSAMRSTTILSAPYFARSMHIAAMQNDTVNFEKSRDLLKNDVNMARTCHNNLVFKYPTKFQRQQDFLRNPAVVQYGVIPGGFNVRVVNGNDLVSKFLQHSDVLVDGSMEDYQAVKANDTMTFRSFFYVLKNWYNAHLAIDESTTLYQLEAEQYAFFSWLGIVLSSVFAALVEIGVVLLMFWPAVTLLFQQFHESIMRLEIINMPQAKLALAAGLTAKTSDLVEEEEDNGDGGSDAGSPSKGGVSPRSKPKAFNFISIATDSDDDKTANRAAPMLKADRSSLSVGEGTEQEASDNLLSPNKLVPSNGNNSGSGSSKRRRARASAAAAASSSSSSLRSDEDSRSASVSPRIRVITTAAGQSLAEVEAESKAAMEPDRFSLVVHKELSIPDAGGVDAVSLISEVPKPDLETLQSVAIDVDAATAAEAASKNRVKAAVATEAKAKAAELVASGRGKFKSEKLETTRRTRIRVLYVASMFLTVAALLGFCVYGVISVQKSSVVAVELTTVNRCQDVISSLNVVSREHTLSDDVLLNLNGSTLPVFDEIDKLQDYLKYQARAALLSHTAFIYGYKQGFVIYPTANGWDRLTANSGYNPYTPKPDLFYAGNRCKGGVDKRTSIANILFHDNCLTELTWRDDGDRASSNPRVQFLAKTLDNDASRCTLHLAHDPFLKGGYHDFFEEIIRGYLRLALIHPTESSPEHPVYLFLEQYTHSSPEFVLGTRKLMLELQKDSLKRIDSTVVAMVLFLVIVAAVVTVQYFVLGRQLSNLLSQNLGMEDVVTRLVTHCALYDTDAADCAQRKVGEDCNGKPDASCETLVEI